MMHYIQQRTYLDERRIIHVAKDAHHELAVHAIGDTTMPRNRLTEIFKLKGPLESTCKEASKRCDNGSKAGNE